MVAVASVVNGETNSVPGQEDDDEDDVVPEESDPESIHAKIVESKRNREKFAIKKSYSIEVRERHGTPQKLKIFILVF